MRSRRPVHREGGYPGDDSSGRPGQEFGTRSLHLVGVYGGDVTGLKVRGIRFDFGLGVGPPRAGDAAEQDSGGDVERGENGSLKEFHEPEDQGEACVSRRERGVGRTDAAMDLLGESRG